MRWQTILGLLVSLATVVVCRADDDSKKAERHIQKAREYTEKGKHESAIQELDRAIELDSKMAIAYSSRGAVRFRMKEYDKAITDLNEAIRLEPEKATSGYYIRGSAWYMKKDYSKGVADFDEAIRLNPKEVDALNGRAWAAATCPEAKYRDSKKAMEYAKLACEVSEWKDPFCISTLAAAYAESGNFEKAIENLEMAMKNKVFIKEYGEDGRKMMALFKDKKPYREEPSK
jgi:tetratricopeptide (TPR) repeat protein